MKKKYRLLSGKIPRKRNLNREIYRLRSELSVEHCPKSIKNEHYLQNTLYKIYVTYVENQTQSILSKEKEQPNPKHTSTNLCKIKKLYLKK